MKKKTVAALFLTVVFAWAVPYALAADSGHVTIAYEDSRVHESYLSGSPDGMFYPDKELTRAELAQILYRIVGEQSETQNDFVDVADDAWYAPAVRTVTSLGMMNGGGNMFYPNMAATRAECASALAYFLPGTGDAGSGSTGAETSFPDVPAWYWAYDAIIRTAEYGLFQGDDTGAFLPDRSLKRCEAAAVFNRLFGRSADANTLAEAGNLQIFPDVPSAHWAYGEIMEAVNTHSCTLAPDGGEQWIKVGNAAPIGLADGFYRINGALYRVQNGHFLYGTTSGVFTFDRDGRYTTGDAALDKQLNAIVEKYAGPVSGRDNKLRALYNYVRDNYTYLKRPLVDPAQTGWEPEYAAFFLEHGKGNCFSFSATYCLLCRELGQDATAVIGGLGKNQSPHGWVMMKLDGVTYMFDPQLEWRYLHDYKKTGYDFFMIRPNKARFQYTWLSVQPS